MSQFTATNDVDRFSRSEGSDVAIDRALRALVDGNPIMIHDGDDREGETDLVFHARAVDAPSVATLRNDAGGLICVALADGVAQAFDLPFLQEAIDHPATEYHDLPYDDRSSFSLTVNHRECNTGIPDNERSRTITSLADAAARPAEIDFATTFRSPGHVHLLRAAPNLLADRQGHTEYGIVLATAAGLAPAVVVCEMLDDTSGEALSRNAARARSRREGIPFVEGRWIQRRFE